ncbi:hypothetical protein [Jannaschia donghaensis]|uniref:Uncharacterized protein n=1 Tax=Jannaschia donghaensis TaxID=420998 RepID=A0A0M6YF22_9RHOB|nr:hypothetical protein [Jannaschia donghaensis]CTQ48938.1 hypothetical protein JDO7802_00946 [Jannaschia donghaensis]
MTYRHEIRMILLVGAILTGITLQHADQIDLADCLLCKVGAILQV